ncbi:flagellar basal body L-ring protein FlgH [Thermodesulfobacteriota bacterium]
MRIATVKKTDPKSRASLWNETTSRDLFQDLRAYRVGDLVTINIVETSKASKKANTKTSRQSSIDAGISNAMGWETKLGKLGIPAALNNENLFKASLKNNFDGSGETSRDESMTASITASVLEVLPNGALIIKGSREIKVNNENQRITLSGLIRPVDISPDNTILSSFVANAKIEYTGSGPVSDKQRPGWLMRFVDFVWPF